MHHRSSLIGVISQLGVNGGHPAGISPMVMKNQGIIGLYHANSRDHHHLTMKKL